MITLSAYIAAIFLLGEVESEEAYAELQSVISKVFILSIISGSSILISSYITNLQFHRLFLARPVSIGAGILATLMVPYIYRLIKSKKIWRLRFVVGAQIILIMMGWFIIQWPNLVIFSDGSVLSMSEASSPLITMKILFYSLTIGVIIIFPSLY
ncbi:MAG: cytochrome d ubiquinol oxidase subunit II [Saprospiraceae bacterium]|jgi:cytochrome d ubiquinol oxidase subunit II